MTTNSEAGPRKGVSASLFFCFLQADFQPDPFLPKNCIVSSFWAKMNFKKGFTNGVRASILRIDTPTGYGGMEGVKSMQEKYSITGMSCAACSARVEKSVSSLPGMKQCAVNLLKNSMVVRYDDQVLTSAQIIQAVEKAGYGASLQTKEKGKSAGQAQSSAAEQAAKEYKTMKLRVIWSFVFTIPLFYISMGHMMGWPLPGFFLGEQNSMIYALTLFCWPCRWPSSTTGTTAPALRPCFTAPPTWTP